MLLLGLALGCSRTNSSFDDTEGTQTSGSLGTGSLSTGPDSAGTNGSDPGTTASMPDPTSTDEGSTGLPEPAQVVVFPGPSVLGNFAASSMDPFATLEELCGDVHDETYASLECPNEIWGVIGTEELPLNQYPLLSGTEIYAGVPIYSPDLETMIAANYGQLIIGNISTGSLAGMDLDTSYWWGVLNEAIPAQTCEGWTATSDTLEGAMVVVNEVPPWFQLTDDACDTEHRVLCLCL